MPEPEYPDDIAWKVAHGHMPAIRFVAYHEKNLHMLVAFITLALQAKRRGKSVWGAMFILNMVRWTMEMKTDGAVYKVSNNFAPYYARLAMHHVSELEGFFVIRTSAVDPSYWPRQREADEVLGIADVTDDDDDNNTPVSELPPYGDDTPLDWGDDGSLY